ncbi:DNA repair ATPase [Polaribacter litorisediminis]|uniref:DNA repair ATPase n=1 Tax=Polaribacter litorisediminis TaxID=1908341 RepID=UPI001CC193DF|nr:DNA repair ATPase [Polaribacter litorisediminis]UAM96917.1 DNA repair ATPase [Polaribacter litorisediminis]
MQKEEKNQKNILEDGTYEIIQGRLQKQKEALQNRLGQLNQERAKVFGSVETKLIANNRINTENNCIARDIVTIGDVSIFGYNVHFGLRTEVKLEDVFSIYSYDGTQFVNKKLDFLQNDAFITDFTNLYKYYRNTIFSKFAMIGNYLHMVFQLSESTSDIKTFKWLINDGTLTYVDNRSEHEFVFPNQHEYKWQEVSRDMHFYGKYPHIGILDKVFVETVGGDLTIKIENNTEDGQGIYSETVTQADQTLDDGQYRFADLGNLIILEIKPFQERTRYFVYNHKIQEVKKINAIQDAAVLLPNDQGIIFSNGYYLQSGAFKIFDNQLTDLKFQDKISSQNGEDFFYVFYQEKTGLYVLMAYNVIEQEVKTPIICSGFTFLKNGELCYFKDNEDQTRHHVIQIWQTPFTQGTEIPSEYKDSLLYKIGNKDIVKAMAECQVLITLLNKEDNYDGLYEDIAKISLDISDSYYWIKEPKTFQLSIPLTEINLAANSAIDEFDKVVQLRKNAAKIIEEISQKTNAFFAKIKSTSFKVIDDFVQALSKLRTLRGEIIGFKEVRYVDVAYLENLEVELAKQTDTISQRCVAFLLDEKALLPYHQRVAEKEIALENISKVIKGKALEKEVNQIVTDLELLIDIVSNLEIEDTSHSTKIIDAISLIFSTINQLKAGIKNKIKALSSEEASADFSSKIKLIDQSIVNYLDIATTPEKTDELLNKVAIQLEDLEGRFADYDEFIGDILEKREEVYNAFQARKSSITEARNKKAISLETAAKRILNGIVKKAESFQFLNEINGYFASDLMINKLRDIIKQLYDLQDGGKAEMIETGLKTAKEDATRKLKDKQDLYEDGENVIKLGKHKFGVNRQVLDLTIVYKNKSLSYHLTGTDFYQEIDNEVLLKSEKYWNQSFVSENEEVYRAAYLAYRISQENSMQYLCNLNDEALLTLVKSVASKSYTEGYTKGVHDLDAFKILKTFIEKETSLGLLRFSPKTRAFSQLFWHCLSEEKRIFYGDKIKASAAVLKVFPKSESHFQLIRALGKSINTIFSKELINITAYQEADQVEIATYLFEELSDETSFSVSQKALTLFEEFKRILKEQNDIKNLRTEIQLIKNEPYKIDLATEWVSSFVKATHPNSEDYLYEVVCLFLYENTSLQNSVNVEAEVIIKDLSGNHPTIKNQEFNFDYHHFSAQLLHFSTVEISGFNQYKKEKHQVTEELKEALKLEEFLPRVLTSFVRNQLIDEVYLPLFGDNLSKQLGSVGSNKRTDRMGMLLLISPPGYGKTTLMEYLANRLGFIFMKINGPAIGHDITSVDPISASNIAAREELKKLNLAFEMGNNVMLYLDDIQHCNPEFLQKFISLADGTRKIEGVYNGQPKTYDFRDKKFCVIMAGNPYTESGDKFQIPDMLANRADIYNLGDIIGDTESLFKMSLIENSLTSNPILSQVSNTNFDDIYQLVKIVETGNREGIELKGNYTKQELNDYLSVLEKVIIIRDRVMEVNAAYIKSAAMDNQNRTEPNFKLQGSYRDMNKLVAKVVPIMNNKELEILLLSHYENESQTLTSAAESNLLKYKELGGLLTTDEKQRWETIKTTFVKNNKLKGFGNTNEMAQVLAQMMQFSEHLEGIQEVLKKGLEK